MKAKSYIAALVSLVILTVSINPAFAAAPRQYSISQAVDMGLKNSLQLQKVKNQGELSRVTEFNVSKKKSEINDANSDLSDAKEELDSGADDVYAAISQLDSAQSALNSGIAPSDIPIKNPTNGQVVFVIARGEDIMKALSAYKMESAYAAVVAEVQKNLNAQRALANEGLTTLNSSTREYNEQKMLFDSSLTIAIANISNKLGLSTITSLDPDAIASLLKVMAEKSSQITAYSYGIYKNKIALLIQNSYIEALKAEKMLEAKKKTVERAKTQYEFAEKSFNVGAKAKDDMLLAKCYYDGALIEQSLSQKDYSNAMLELKKNMGIPQTDQISLQMPPLASGDKLVLDSGIKTGLNSSLEIKMAAAQKAVYEELVKAVHNSNYSSASAQYQEARLLAQNAELDLKSAQINVESSIRQSFETVIALKMALDSSKDLQSSAEETLKIAKAKYDAGFGSDSSLLQNMNLQQMSGTIVEVIAASENLSGIQEKIIELNGSYNLALAKYLNDIGIFAY